MSENATYQETELLLRIEKGDQLAFAQLMNVYKNNIYTTAMHIVKSAEVAEEVVQDVFVIIWKKRTALRTVDNFPAYLYGIARYTIYHALKNIIQQRERKLKGMQDAGLLFHQDTEEWLNTKEFQLILQKAVARLPERQKQVFTLIKQEGCTREEVAVKMQVSAETVKSNLNEATRKVRAYCLHYQHVLIGVFCFLLKFFL